MAGNRDSLIYLSRARRTPGKTAPRIHKSASCSTDSRKITSNSFKKWPRKTHSQEWAQTTSTLVRCPGTPTRSRRLWEISYSAARMNRSSRIRDHLRSCTRIVLKKWRWSTRTTIKRSQRRTKSQRIRRSRSRPRPRQSTTASSLRANWHSTRLRSLRWVTMRRWLLWKERLSRSVIKIKRALNRKWKSWEPNR